MQANQPSDQTSAYCRSSNVLWRLAVERVIVRRVGDRSPMAAGEVAGSAAVVWLALDRPRTAIELKSALEAAACADPSAELELALIMLRDCRLIEEELL